MRADTPFPDSNTPREKRRERIFYGWIVVLVSFFSMLMSLGARNSFSVFYVAIMEDFSWSRASAASILSMTMFVYGVASPLVGAALDRFGPRKLFPLGAILLGLGLIGCGQASSLWHFYLLFGLVGAVGASVLGLFPHSAIVSNWFVRRRGTAISLASVGGGASSLLAILAERLITAAGWRNAFVVMGIAVVAVVAPLAGLLQRHKPADKGLFPDGETDSAAEQLANQAQHGGALPAGRNPQPHKPSAPRELTLTKAAGTREYWCMNLVFFFSGMAFSLMLAHQVAFFVGIGYSRMFAAWIFGFYGLINVMGRVAGYISDRIGREMAFAISCLLGILAMLVLLTAHNAHDSWRAYSYAIGFGLAMGLSAPVSMAATADLFQGRNLGRISGSLGIGYGLGGAFGPWVGGFIYDTTHSYAAAFCVVILSLALCSGSMWLAAPRRVWTPRTSAGPLVSAASHQAGRPPRKP